MHSLTLYIICGLFLCQHTTAQWDPYPACVQRLNSQLNNGPADCNFGWSTQEEINQSNACLCPNEGYESETARAIYTNCGCNDLIASASLMVTACILSGSVSIYDEAQIISAGDGGQSFCQNIDPSSVSAVVPKSTVTIPNPAAPTSSNGGNGIGICNGNSNCSGSTIVVNSGKSSANSLSSPAKIAIGITVPVVVLALASFLWYTVRRHRQRRRLIFENQSREVPDEPDNRNIVYQKGQWDIKPQLGANEAQWPDVQ